MDPALPAPATPDAITPQKLAEQRLEYLPVSIFAIVMGMAGLTLVWLKAHTVLGMPILVGEGLRGLASALFGLLLVLYVLKMVRYPQAVTQEMRHPIRLSFFPMVSISLLLLALCYLEAAPGIAYGLWVVGAAVHLCLTLAIFSSWLHHTHYTIQHANPSWFVPVVGNIIISVVGGRLALPELSWFFFSIGMVFWIVLLTIILYRLIFHEPLPARLTPTIFILLAPPSVGFIAYTNLTGGLDAFARILYYMALFLALLLASNALRFLRLPFFISAWACSFPLTAFTLATLIMSTYLPGTVFKSLGYGLLVFLSLLITALAARTLLAIWRRQICLPE